jgi:lipoprotein-anchoring transpeptidase ErfK/SrfK
MSADDLERRLSEAFEAQARGRVPDSRLLPPMAPPEHHRHRSGPARWLAPTAAAAAVLLVVAVIIGLSGGSAGNRPAAIGSSTASTSRPESPAVSSTTSPKPAAATPVHVSLKFSDGARVGVGMPIIALLSHPIKDAHAFAKATRVTVNGKPAAGGWYFEARYDDPGHPIEADYRLPTYWPAHAKIHLTLAVKGVSAGTGLVFDNSLSLNFSTGAANILTVDNTTHRLTVQSDGKPWGTFPVSLGARTTPTSSGTKVIMEKADATVCMRGPGYNRCRVRYTQRLTYGGEYLHAAPWNVAHIKAGVNSSNGCTNLLTADAKRLYGFLEIGDVVRYPNADGAAMQLGDGYGVWNVSWSQWQTGGLYAVR